MNADYDQKGPGAFINQENLNNPSEKALNRLQKSLLDIVKLPPVEMDSAVEQLIALVHSSSKGYLTRFNFLLVRIFIPHTNPIFLL